jgi:hypothetical protein
MRIKLPITQYHEVTLDDRTLRDIFKRKLTKLTGWNENMFCKDGVVYEKKEYYTSHTFEIDEVQRDATDDDYKNEEIFNYLITKLREEQNK